MGDGGRVWMITGASRGLGRAFVDAVAAAGDTVVATARRPESLDDLVAVHGDRVVPMRLDVDHKDDVDATVAAILTRFGRIDVVVNNAGYGLRGAVEEVTEAEARAQIETNFFGVLWVTKAVLPSMRAAGSGHIVQMSSTSGLIAFAGLGMYSASKWAVEGLTESLAKEVAPLGIRVTLLEPAGFRSDWAGESQVHATWIDDYRHLPGRSPDAPIRTPPGDPVKLAAALLAMVNAPNPPRRVLFGSSGFDMVQEAYHGRLVEWDEWKALARSTDSTEESGPAS